jgi:hypothetical protein
MTHVIEVNNAWAYVVASACVPTYLKCYICWTFLLVQVTETTLSTDKNWHSLARIVNFIINSVRLEVSTAVCWGCRCSGGDTMPLVLSFPAFQRIIVPFSSRVISSALEFDGTQFLQNVWTHWPSTAPAHPRRPESWTPLLSCNTPKYV